MICSRSIQWSRLVVFNRIFNNRRQCSQLSDGAAAQIVMDRAIAEAEGKEILGIYRGFQAAGCARRRWGSGRCSPSPGCLTARDYRLRTWGLWEINEAFASQGLYCRDALGIRPEIYNVNGGAIAVGHPFGITGARLVGHALIEGRKWGVRWLMVSMCTAGGMRAAGLFEIV